MKKELQDKLLNQFPKLYRQYYLTVQESCMPWGFDCPDEWFSAIWELSERISQYTETTGILIEAVQVKEKFGGLRFYYDVVTQSDSVNYDYIHEMILDAEHKVDKIEGNYNEF